MGATGKLKAAACLAIGIYAMPTVVQAGPLRLATPAELETRYSCGGGGVYSRETGIQWYREWDGCYVKYPSRLGMSHKMWTVGKMDYRPTTMRGGPNNVILTLPHPGTHTPNETIIDSVFDGESPFIQQTILYSADHLGNYWAVANEPNWWPLFAPADYAREFRAYAEYIKGFDPTARMTSGGILVSNHFTGPDYSGTKWHDWIDQFRSAYQSRYGTQPPVDVWDIHPYDAPDYSNGTTPAQKTINNIIAMRQYLDNAGLSDAPIWISEIACFTDDDQMQIDFINELFSWLNANAGAYKVDRWFWWGSTTTAFGPSGLFDGSYNRAHINAKGDAYMKQMGRVFVDPVWVPEPTRIKGSMRNPYASITEVIDAFRAGLDGLSKGNIVYDFSTGSNYVLAITPTDFDRDGDVDMTDFGHFQACLSGPLVPQTDPDCTGARLDSDADVDQADTIRFLQCLTGAGFPADPDCAN